MRKLYKKNILIITLLGILIGIFSISLVNASYENFTKYTEVDVNWITIQPDEISVRLNGDWRDATRLNYIYKTETTFNGFDISFGMNVASIQATTVTTRANVMIFEDEAPTYTNVLDNTNDNLMLEISGDGTTQTSTFLLTIRNNANGSSNSTILNVGTTYYYHYYANSTYVWCDVYTDSTYTTLDSRIYHAQNSANTFNMFGLAIPRGIATATTTDIYVYNMTWNAPMTSTTTVGGGIVGTNYDKELIEIISVTVEISKNTNKRIQTITTLVEINKIKYEYLQDIISGIMIEKNGFLVYSSFWGKSSLLNASIKTDIDNWLFENEIYELTAYFNNTNEGRITLSDTIHTIDFVYQNYTGFRETAFLEVRNQDGTLINDIVAQSLETEIEERTINITKVTWKFILNKEIVDCVDRYLTYKTIDINGLSTTGTILNQNYNIYNLGGLSEYSFYGTGGRIKGGDTLELVVKTEGDYAQSYVYFRKLQAVNMLFEVWGNESVTTTYFDENNGIEIRFEMEFWYNNQWNDGWEVRINPIDADVGTLGVDDDCSWVELNVRWYYDDVFVKQDNIVVYHHGYDKDRFPTENRYYMLWLDMWFNRMNASTVVGGRVNGYYNGMKELGTWWFGYGDFRPFTGNTTYSMYFDDLTVGGEIVPSTELELMRFRAYITKTSDLNNGRWNSIKNYQVLEWKLADDRMMGINTPPFTEAKDITIPKTTILTPLITAIQSIGQFMWNGVVGAGRVLIGAIDSFMLYLGFNITLSTMLNFVGMQFDSLIFYITTVTEYASDITYIFTSLVIFIVSIIGYVINAFIWIIIWVLPLPIHIITFFVAILKGGVWSYGDYITLDFAIGFPIVDGMMQLLPMFLVWSYFMWLFFGNDEREDDLTGLPRRVIETFRYIREAQTEVFWVFTRMYNSVISLYNFIRSHIPFLSSGGGEQSEQ